MSKVVAALGRRVARHGGADRVPQDLPRATARLPQDRLQLRKRQFNRIEIGTVFRQKPELGADVLNGPPDRWTLVTGQIVHDDDVAGGERRRQDLFDVGEEARAIDGAIKHGGRGKAGDAQRAEKRRRVPAPIWRVVGDAGAVETAAVAPNQIRTDATFIEKDEARGIEGGRRGKPGYPREDDVSAIVFRCAYRFF